MAGPGGTLLSGSPPFVEINQVAPVLWPIVLSEECVRIREKLSVYSE